MTALPATLDHAAAETAEDKVGRLVYAKLGDRDPSFVQPGDFVTVRIPARPMEAVAVIPATAATPDGRILLIDEKNRLEDVQLTVLRHQGDLIIVEDAPIGRQYVTARALQLGPGIQVTPVLQSGVAAAREAAAPPETAPDAAPETIALEDDRRAAIIAFIAASEKMKPEKRAQFLKELGQPEVPRATEEVKAAVESVRSLPDNADIPVVRRGT